MEPSETDIGEHRRWQRTTIWKYDVGPLGEYITHEMPKGCTFLDAQAQQGRAVMWFEVDPEAPRIKVQFIAVGTGYSGWTGGEFEYLGTVQLGSLVHHVYWS